MKAMRDEKGEMVRNAHLIGFFRRICKLLFLRTKPVFIFDGGTPALKRRTVVARRRQRENAQAKIRKTAEKLLLNHLKAQRLEELAKEMRNTKVKDDSKGKQVLSDQNSLLGSSSEQTETVTNSYNQESVDELLAASLAAQEDGTFPGTVSTSGGGVPAEEDYDEDEDEDEEMIFPVIHGSVDPAVLASLPPSMQLDLLVQMRERLMAENRQKYQKVKKAPAKFSELQIQAYLKTVAFRREIDEVQKSAAGSGVAGVKTSRIASEANREFIFSSSFTGDKQILTSTGVEKNGGMEHQTMETESIPSDAANGTSSTFQFHSVAGAAVDEPRTETDHDVATYIDERGHVRVSRVRGLGIHMTRDLQRNLDLMKELEQEKIKEKIYTNGKVCNDIVGTPRSLPENTLSMGTSIDDRENHETVGFGLSGRTDKTLLPNQSIHVAKNSIEISFSEDDIGHAGADDNDDLFAHLVAGSSLSQFTSENICLDKHVCDSASGCLGEENLLKSKGGSSDGHINHNQQSFVDGKVSHEDEVLNKYIKDRPDFVDDKVGGEDEVDWEDGDCALPESASPCPNEQNKSISKGSLEEEADFQEAIRRSLKDFGTEKSVLLSSESAESKEPSKIDSSPRVMTFDKDEDRPVETPLEIGLQKSQLSCEVLNGLENHEKVGGGDMLHMVSPSKKMMFSATSAVKTDMESIQIGEESQPSMNGVLSHKFNEDSNICKKTQDTDQDSTLEPMGPKVSGQERHLDNSNYGKRLDSTSESTNSFSDVRTPAVAVIGDILLHAYRNNSHISNSGQSSEMRNVIARSQEGSVTEASVIEDHRDLELIRDENCYAHPAEGGSGNKTTLQDELEFQFEESEANLDEEMLLLKQERIDLGDEQRRLERNAESVSTEMFAECQELLQMFGLPYIIAPMEAEAQCAYMELIDLVDGVVTDDSDVFLFGARSVYKNIFDDRKYVETYFMKDIESELGLTREKLIRMALLLGSDYTEGIRGIGIVNAIEVVNAFPEEDGLQKFREWIESPDPSILGKLGVHTGDVSMKKSSKVSRDSAGDLMDASPNDNTLEGHDSQQSLHDLSDLKQVFMDKHRNVSKNWHIPSSFPSESVVSAYTSPQVDNSTEPFSWGKPDLFVLRKLCWDKFGWSNQKADELLVPVLKEYSKRETQLRLEAFYTFNERFAKIRSQRIKKAVKGITGNQSSELMDDTVKRGNKSRKRSSEAEKDKDGRTSDKLNDGVGGEGDIAEKTASKQPRKQRRGKQHMQSEVGGLEPVVQKRGKHVVKKGANRNASRRGRGRGRGVGPRKKLRSDSSETSSGDAPDVNAENDAQVEETKDLSELRRSVRPRNEVSYAANDLASDGISSSSSGGDANLTDKGAAGQEKFQEIGMVEEAHGSGENNQENVPLEENRDYLLSGGGFCINETDQIIDPIQSIPSPTGISREPSHERRIAASEASWSLNDKHFAGDGSNIKEPPGEHKDEMNNISYSGITATQEPEVGTGLSAMPALRRKRRKSRS